jgi:hypothetical protein
LAISCYQLDVSPDKFHPERIRFGWDRKQKNEEKEIDKLEGHLARFTHRSRGRVCFSAIAALWATIFDTGRAIVDSGIFYYRMLHSW